MAAEKTTTTPRGDGEMQPLLRQPGPRHRVKTAILAALALTATVSVFRTVQFFTPGIETENNTDDDGAKPWSWADVTPSRDLKWVNCYNDTLECARLDVPMDWLDPTDEERVIIGITKLPAKTKDSPLPPVFLNPGGPGGSGIHFVQKLGAQLQTIVGNNQDIISFDPRGVGVTTPRMDCWGSVQKREMWEIQETVVADARPGLAYDDFVRKTALSGVCEQAMNSTGIMHHMSSASVARDMLQILDQTGHSKLRYWGFSYGTILGGVFAGLYPDRVERLVSDGNVDYKSWFNLEMLNFVSDADSIFDAIDSACHNAGPEKCALWAETPQAVQDRRAGVLSSLKRIPLVVPAWSRETGPEMPEVITYSKVQLVTRGIVYSPLGKVELMAEAYAALEAGDPLPFYDLQNSMTESPVYGQMCAVEDIPAMMPRPIGSEPDVFAFVMCSDAVALNDTPEEYASAIEQIQGVSKWMGAANAFLRGSCLGRTMRPKWRFSEDDFRGDTAHPILFIGNIADNVTPLASARNNSARFPSSVVLTQNSYGHCSVAAASMCTAKYVHAYFQDGTLPEPGTICEPNYDLFEQPTRDEVREQDEFSSAVSELADLMDFGRFGGAVM